MRPRSSNSRNPGSRIPRRGGLSSTSLNYQKEARCIAPVLRMSGYKRGVHRQLTRVKHCNGRNSERVVPNKELANAKEQPGEPKEYNVQIQRKSAVSPVASSGGPPLARNHQTFLDQQAPKMDESLYVMRMSRRATYRWSKRNRKLGDLDGGGPYR